MPQLRESPPIPKHHRAPGTLLCLSLYLATVTALDESPTTIARMCGRYVTPTQAEMERYWQLTDAQIRNQLDQRLNTSPTALVPMLRPMEGGGLELVAARWGNDSILVEGAETARVHV